MDYGHKAGCVWGVILPENLDNQLSGKLSYILNINITVPITISNQSNPKWLGYWVINYWQLEEVLQDNKLTYKASQLSQFIATYFEKDIQEQQVRWQVFREQFKQVTDIDLGEGELLYTSDFESIDLH